MEDKTKVQETINEKPVGASMVVGGGIGGMQAALDLAESGIKVYLLDSSPSIGGVMAQLDKTFPTNDCAMCTMAPRLVEVSRHKDIEILSLSNIEKIEGQAGNFVVRVKKKARYVDEDKCTGCGVCVANCPVHNIIYVTPEKDKIEISPEDMKTIDSIIQEFKTTEENLVPILQKTNAAYNYLPEPALRYISEKMDIPLSVVYRIATFYNAFSLKPRGKYVITICLGTACHVKGAADILSSFEQELKIKSGSTTADMMFTLETVRCIGCCGLAPVLKVNEDVHGLFTKEKVPELIEQYKGA